MSHASSVPDKPDRCAVATSQLVSAPAAREPGKTNSAAIPGEEIAAGCASFSDRKIPCRRSGEAVLPQAESVELSDDPLVVELPPLELVVDDDVDDVCELAVVVETSGETDVNDPGVYVTTGV